MIKIRFYGNLQSVVDGAPNRHEHLVLAEIGVNAGERARWARKSGVEYGSRIKSVPCIVRNRSTARDRAIHRGACCKRRTPATTRTGAAHESSRDRIEIGWSCTAEATESGLHCVESVTCVQCSCRANVVNIDSQQVVQGNVSHVVHRQDGTMAELPLNADVHLDGIGRTVVWSDKLVAGRIGALGECVPHKAAI